MIDNHGGPCNIYRMGTRETLKFIAVIAAIIAIATLVGFGGAHAFLAIA